MRAEIVPARAPYILFRGGSLLTATRARSTRLRPLLWPAVLILLGTIAYVARVRHEMVDFAVYRTAGARVLEAAPLFRVEDGHYQFKYFPAFAFAMVPFGILRPETGKAVWFALSVGLLAMLVRWSVRALPEPRMSEQHLIWLTVVLMAKFYAHELNLGQTNILLGALLVRGLVAAQTGRPAVAGVLAGLGVFVKPYALILVPWLFFAAGLTGMTAFAAILVAGLLLPAIVYGWQGNLQLVAGWYRTVTETTAPNLLAPENVSFATMWAKWLGGPGPTPQTLAIVTAAAVVTLAATAWLARRRVRQPAYLEFGLLMMLVPLLSPQGWDYVLVIATPAIVCLVDRLGKMSRAWQLATMAGMGLMSFTIYDLLGRALYARMMAWSVVSVGAIVLLVSLVQLRWRRLA
jgi:hypothetical protein